MPDEPITNVTERMREDWNDRARDDAAYWVAYGGRDSDDAAFFATATGVINRLDSQLKRVPIQQRGAWKALEVGCGPGRLMRPMSNRFLEIHGVDVSEEVIVRAKERLADLPNAYVHVSDGASLSMLAEESFDFVYSYAVFPRIPSREVIFAYLREIRRVMKTGGLCVLQFTGLQNRRSAVDSWDGVRFTSRELLEFATSQDFQVLTLEGITTQYMWTTWRKQPRGLLEDQMRLEDQSRREIAEPVLIRRITNAQSSEPLAPCRGRYASIAIWVEHLPPDAGLNQLRVMVGDSLGTITDITPPDNASLQQIHVQLPELEATGLLPVDIFWGEQKISPPATLRIIPPAPMVPCVVSIADGQNLASDRIASRSVKVTLEEISRPDEVEVSVDGMPVLDLELFCTDPRPQRFDVNFVLPEDLQPGTRHLELRIGRRKMAPIPLVVV